MAFAVGANRAVNDQVTTAASTVNEMLSLVARRHLRPTVFAETISNLRFPLPNNIINSHRATQVTSSPTLRRHQCINARRLSRGHTARS